MSEQQTAIGESASSLPQIIRVLVVEDARDFTDHLRNLLEQSTQNTFVAEFASNFAEGLRRLSEAEFDVILIDLAISDGAGLGNVDQIQSITPHLPIIVMGSVNDETLALNAVQEGVQDYLVKDRLDAPLLSRAVRYAVERKRSENALLRAEEKYHRIFENSVEGIFQTTGDGHYIDVNPALARIYGYESPDELIKRVTDIARSLYVDPARRDEFVRRMEQNDIVTGFESQIHRKDGSIIWISENVRAIRDAAGRLLYYEGTVEDVTDRRRAQEQLENSEALYHSLVETLPQNIFRKDLSERFTFANCKFCHTLGRPLEDIVGKTDFDFFPAELAAQYQKDDRWVMESGKIFQTIEENEPPGGEKIYVQVVKTPLYDAKGRIIGLQGIFWDITEERKAQERERKALLELAASQEELRQKNHQLESDIRMAREIQMALLPQQYPAFRGASGVTPSALRFCHMYHPSGAVGGDFFYVLQISDTAAGIFICDVMGHDVRAALVTAMVRALVEELKPVAHDPGKLLTHLNRDLRAILKQTGNLVFTTAFYLVVDLEGKEFRYASAGHPKPLLVRRATETVSLLEMKPVKTGPALGFFENSNYSAARADLMIGDIVLLFTDGLIEVEGPDESLFTHEMLLDVVQKRVHLPLHDLFEEMVAEVKRFSGGEEFQDDLCVVAVEVADTP